MNINFFHKYVVCFKCCKQKIENMVNESVCTVLIKKIFCWTKTKLKLHLINSKEKSENFSSVNKILREEIGWSAQENHFCNNYCTTFLILKACVYVICCNFPLPKFLLRVEQNIPPFKHIDHILYTDRTNPSISQYLWLLIVCQL